MDFMKILDQTVREIKREVNLKVLKVPEIEQKVLDATNDEAWGPHGTALSEIAQATRKITECQLIMNVLWIRLTDTGPNWRHVYKALTVIEYLMANGSERAVDDILEHTFQISAISGFEYVDPSGKDVGINVRKKVETILALLNDREKIQAVRDKAATNRDKYIGLSSTGISFRSSSASYSSSNSFDKNDHYGSGSRDGDSFKNSSKEGEQYEKDSKRKHEIKESENFQNVGDGKSQFATRKKDSSPSNSSKILNNPAAVPSKTPIANPNVEEEDFGDFDPRGSSASTVTVSTNQMDLFGPSLVGDLMDADGDPSFSPNVNADDGAAAGNTDVDLFADATFQSASPAQSTPDSHNKGNVDPFASQNSFPAFPGNVDLFAASDAGLPAKTMPAETLNAKSFDPFAEIPINNFSGSDPFDTFASHAAPISTQPSSSTNTSSKYIDEETFGDFTSHTEQTIPEHSSRSSLSNMKTPTTSAPASRKDNFHVKSGVWADCLSRGLIDLNISAPKKVNLADIGIVGGLEDAASNEKEKGPSTTTAFMGRAMGSGSGLGWSGYSTAASASGSYTTYGQQEYGSFK